MRRLRRRGER